MFFKYIMGSIKWAFIPKYKFMKMGIGIQCTA
jgi:hypothetical protein